jgi:hypothetical protein
MAEKELEDTMHKFWHANWSSCGYAIVESGPGFSTGQYAYCGSGSDVGLGAALISFEVGWGVPTASVCGVCV